MKMVTKTFQRITKKNIQKPIIGRIHWCFLIFSLCTQLASAEKPIVFTLDGPSGNIAMMPYARPDNYSTTINTTISRTAADPDDLLDNDNLVPDVSSFGGGSLGGTMNDHPAGTTATVGGHSVTVNADGSFTYVPASGFSGNFTFYYNSMAAGASALVTIAVQNVCPPANIIYVNDDAGGANNGSSWADAFTDLQNALNSPCPGITEIWVAAGTYKPGTARTDAFVMKNNLAIYGGFVGTETLLSQRNWTTNVTILSGEIGGAGNADNSCHVIFNDNNGLNATAVIDGFTVTGGYADGDFPNESGGGMSNLTSSPTVINCSFIGNSATNSGGGMLNFPFSSPTLTNCTFSGNSATRFGGGMLNFNSSSPTLTNCSFSGNFAAESGGGMINFNSSSPTLTNCSFSGNSAANNGGGMGNDVSSPTLTNCSFSGNSAANNGGGMFNLESSPTLANCILWGNSSEIFNASSTPTVTYSIVQGGYSPCTNCPNGNGDIDPLFVSTSDLRLQECSPALDAGNDAANMTTLDLDGNPRKFEAIAGGQMIDMGAYEFQSAFVPLTTYYTDGDGDQYGTGPGQEFCTDPGAGWATVAGDCNDGDPAINPGATEVCDGVDNNCVGGIDEGNVCCPAGNIFYVNDDAAGANDGSSWTNAFNDLQDALTRVCPNIDQIWVAAGTYTPGTARTDAFVMKNNLAIYGGFAGGETSLGQRNADPATNGTVLSGEIGAAGIPDNSQTVVNGSGTDNTAILDGFTITAGNADGSFNLPDPARGGGMFIENGSPMVTNCLFSNNIGLLGGGMNNSNASPTITNCTFLDNQQTFGGFGGGAIMNEGNSGPIISDCIFEGNSGFLGGALYFSGTANPSVTNCDFMQNTATYSGGAIYQSGSINITATNCTFTGNSANGAGGGGGGIWNQSSSSPTLTNCTFTGNSAANNGGGMYNIDSSPTLDNCSFIGNSAAGFGAGGGGMYNAGSSPTLTNCTFSGNSGATAGAGGGGGMWNIFNSSPTLTNCTFSGNSAAGFGGGMNNLFSSSPTLYNCTFTGNSANSGGGGMWNQENSSPTLTNCILWGNGSEIFNINSVPTVSYSIVQGGYSPCTKCPNGDGDVDPLFVSSSDLHLTECSPALDAGNDGANATATDLDGNARKFEAIAGGHMIDLGAYEFQSAFVPLTTYYTDGDGDQYGTGPGQEFCTNPGAGWATVAGDCNDGDPAINPGATEVCDGVDNNCVGGIDEGNVCCPAGNIFYVNDDAAGANDGSSWANAFNDLQDALTRVCPNIDQIWVAAGTYTPGTARTDAFVMKNNLAIYGGFAGGETNLGQRNADPATNGTILSGEIGMVGIADNSYTVVNGSGTDNTAILDGFTITAGNADGNTNFPDPASRGGGMFINEGSPMVTNCRFSNNIGLLGGGMNNSNASPTITNCTFLNNQQTFGGFGGGGMMNEGDCNPVISQSSFSDNTGRNGAGIYFSGSTNSTLTDCTFTNNISALGGGGVYQTGSINLTLTNCTFIENTALYGGAFTASGFAPAAGSSSFTDCNFMGNTATRGFGGAIQNGFTNTTADVLLTFTKCTFKDNTSQGPTAGYGGAYTDLGAATFDADFINCLFDGNKALHSSDEGYGGALMVYGGKVTLTNSTIVNSEATTGAGGIYFGDPFGTSSSFSMKNSILWNNIAPNGSDILSDSGNANAEYSLIQNADCPPNVTCGAGMIFNQDPLFTNGLQLSECSPAIDGGTAVGAPLDDIDGNARPVNAAPNIAGDFDMGAYEFQGTTPLPIAACQSQVVQLDNTGNGSIAASMFSNNSTGCGLTFSAGGETILTFDCSQLGANPITLTANDIFGQQSTCNTTVTVRDEIAPVPTCKTSTVQLDATGNYSLQENDVFAGGTDNCGNVNFVSMTPTSVNCSNIGTPVSVTVTATDGNGNNAECTATITVEDNIAPSANCTTTTINAVLDANGNYSVNPNEINDGSSDACGGVTLAVSPSLLNCQHEGLNTITLTATDIYGNSSSCTATIDLAPFISNIAISPTAETCEGAGDGVLTILATAGGGQLGYSIDGGASFQYSGIFNNLSPGTYNILLKVFGVPNTCEKTAVATILGGPTPTTWFKDEDGDGYTDGNTQTSCTQPTGYAANAQPGDCNDNDPMEFPGQIWYKDADGDNYTDGTTLVACVRPSGYKAVGELVNTTDIDCDDNNAAINHSAAEVCNGIDDDCDGEIDEGTSGNLTWTGNVYFSTQQQVDDWSACYSIINGNVQIIGAGINDLSPLSNIVQITGNLTIQSTGLANMNGLDGLTTLGGALNILFNSSLTTLDGLDALATVGGSLYLYYNFQLSDCCAIYTLINGGVAGSKVIFYNKVGCNSVAEINNNCNPAPLVGSNGAFKVASASIQQAVTVFPNPAKGAFTVIIPQGFDNGELLVLDITGRPVGSSVLTKGQVSYRFDSSQLSTGVYLVCVKAVGQPTQVRRLVVE